MTTLPQQPPIIARWILSCLLNHNHPESILADFEEIYNDLINEKGLLFAKLWYCLQILVTFPSFINNSLYWITTMLLNNLKIAFRILVKQKIYSFINLTGLAVGMACTILILLWIQNELSRDMFHDNIDNLYRVYQKFEYSSNKIFYTDNTSGLLASELESSFKEVKKSSRFLPGGMKSVRYDDKSHDEFICYADQSFFEMFSYKLLFGNKETALTNPSSIIITRNIAEKYFRHENPIGKTLNIDNQYDFKVTGVVENFTQSTHLYYINFIIPFSATQKLLGSAFETWSRNWPKTYLLLDKEASKYQFETKIADVVKKYNPNSNAAVYLQPVGDIGHYTFTGELAGIRYVYIFLAAAFFILFIACVNFINLSTARANRRTVEVGVRKVIGADRRSIIHQFFSESLLYSIIALIVALLITYLLLPFFNELTAKNLSLNLLENKTIIGIILLICVITGLLSGIYPAFYLSSFETLKIIKGDLRFVGKASSFRNTLIVIQFTLSIVLIICTAIIYHQINFIQTGDLGYDENNLLYVGLKSESREKYDVIKGKLEESSFIEGVTLASKIPTSGGDSTPDNDWEGKDPNLSVMLNRIYVDYDFIQVMGMEMISGRAFSPKPVHHDNSKFEIILNEEAVRRMQIENPVGKKFITGGIDYTIVGIVKDYHFSSFHTDIEPIAICSYPKYANVLFVRFSSSQMKSSIDFLESAWEEINPNLPFSYGFIEDRINELYWTEKRLGDILKYSSFLAIFLAGIGLMGLTSYITEQRTKEIGIRKVLGSSISGIMSLLTKELMKWVFIANVIAWPIAWYFMHQWLQEFAYKVPINVWWFIFAGSATLIITFIMVTSQILRIVRANPVDCLRYE
jgi:ABC-type antimicrobial peptide transport system permease subunit